MPGEAVDVNFSYVLRCNINEGIFTGTPAKKPCARNHRNLEMAILLTRHHTGFPAAICS